MRESLKAYGVSFLLHFALLLIVIAFSTNLQKRERVVELDLSFLEVNNKTEEKVYKESPKPQSLSENRRIKEVPLVQRSFQESPIKEKVESPNTPPPEEPSQQQENTTPTKSDNKLGTEGYSSPTNPNTNTKGNNLPKDASENKHGQATARASTTTTEQQREHYLKEKLFIISQIVQKNISYPPLARRMAWEGKVVLAIRLGTNGNIEDIKVIESSGYDILDRNAVDTVKRVSHLFPKPPVEVIVRLPVNYKLE